MHTGLVKRSPALHRQSVTRAAINLLRRVARRPSALTRRAIEGSLAIAEKRLTASWLTPQFPPLFVIGLPRVGSTLFTHALIRRFSLSYISNAAALFPRAIGVTSVVLGRLQRVRPHADFRNAYGVIPGRHAPAQGRELWGRWFPMDQSWVAASALSPEAYAEMRATIAVIESAFAMPFANKAQGHAVRIDALCEAFPTAVFVRVVRDRLEVAQSILKSRREYFRDENRWFSAKPSNYRELSDLDPYDQIAGQILGIERDMHDSFTRVGTQRVFDVNYRDFCHDPTRCLDEVHEFYVERSGGIVLSIRAQAPVAFSVRSAASVSVEDTRLLQDALERALASRR